MKKSESIKELGTALSKAQSELKPLIKNAANPYFKSSYADLSESVEKILPVFSKHGLSVAQGGEDRGSNWVIETILIHSSGEWLSFDWPVVIARDKAGPQDFASASTYARRYALQAIAGAAAEDDDANKSESAARTPAPKPLVNHAPSKAPPDAWPPPEFHDDIHRGPDPKFVSVQSFTITFGKHTGKTLKDIGLSEAKNYATWLKDSNAKSGKAMGDKAKEFCDLVATL